MKAKEYYDIIMSFPQDPEGISQAVSKIFIMMSTEAKELITKRKAVRGQAIAAIVREQNDKWNAIIAIYENKNKWCPLKRNGFWNHWTDEIPDLKKYR